MIGQRMLDNDGQIADHLSEPSILLPLQIT